MDVAVEGSGPQKSLEVSATALPTAYLWLIGNGGMGNIISTITTILPFPTNQR